ncbi:MAG: hypothetical protein GYA17_00075 [Chloroflexi bacterium]|nr:hypothetical protein [Chloroflexota bacterium]
MDHQKYVQDVHAASLNDFTKDYLNSDAKNRAGATVPTNLQKVERVKPGHGPAWPGPSKGKP